MQRAGRPSWRFAHDFDESLHVLLYLRDALGLETVGGAATPPPLLGGPPKRPDLLDAASRAQASRNWSAWWSSMVAETARMELGPVPDGPGRREWMAEVHRAHARRSDPPDWVSLAEWPELQRGASVLWREAQDWFFPARAPYLPPGRLDVLAWERVRHAAERVAASHRVDLGALNGCALVLLVEGVWWDLVAPGAAVCSVGAALDPEATDAILTAVLTSHLGAG